MTSSTSCSSRSRFFAAALLLAIAAQPIAAEPAAQPTDQPSVSGDRASAPTGPRRVALFPVDNISGTSAPLRELRGAIELALARAGLEVVSGDAIEQFLLRHRIRYTGGIDAATARQAGEDLGVEGVVLTSVERYMEAPPQLALSMRLVAARSDATLLWFDGVSRGANDSPGLLGLGIIPSMEALQQRVLTQLARSLAATLAGRAPAAPRCEDGGRFRPKVRYRSPALEPGERYSVAVVPFRNLTNRRNAGDLVALEFLRQFAGTDVFRAVEPGVVRDVILKERVVMEGGISVDQVRTLLGAIGADFVMAGDVVEFADGAGVPAVNFTATLLDGRTGEIAWQSTSFNKGDDRVWFFGLGTVRTAPSLTCRMVRTAIDDIFRVRPPPGAVRRVEPEVPVGPRKGEYHPPSRDRSAH